MRDGRSCRPYRTPALLASCRDDWAKGIPLAVRAETIVDKGGRKTIGYLAGRRDCRPVEPQCQECPSPSFGEAHRFIWPSSAVDREGGGVVAWQVWPTINAPESSVALFGVCSDGGFRFGIPVFDSHRHKWRPEDDKLLGLRTDDEIAALLRTSVKAVAHHAAANSMVAPCCEPDQTGIARSRSNPSPSPGRRPLRNLYAPRRQADGNDARPGIGQPPGSDTEGCGSAPHSTPDSKVRSEDPSNGLQKMTLCSAS